MGIKSRALFIYQAPNILYICQHISNDTTFCLPLCIYLIISSL